MAEFRDARNGTGVRVLFMDSTTFPYLQPASVGFFLWFFHPCLFSHLVFAISPSPKLPRFLRQCTFHLSLPCLLFFAVWFESISLLFIDFFSDAIHSSMFFLNPFRFTPEVYYKLAWVGEQNACSRLAHVANIQSVGYFNRLANA